MTSALQSIFLALVEDRTLIFRVAISENITHLNYLTRWETYIDPILRIYGEFASSNESVIQSMLEGNAYTHSYRFRPQKRVEQREYSSWNSMFNKILLDIK